MKTTDQLNHYTVTRRDFLKTLGAGLAVTFTLTELTAGLLEAPYLDEGQLGSWIHIGADGKVTVFTGSSDGPHRDDHGRHRSDAL
jgi:hypothetical protein